MSVSKVNHIHKLKRHKYKTTGNAVFFCTEPDCNFKIEVKLSLGKRTVCHRCGKPFLINERAIRMANPHCDNCVKRKDDHAKETKIISRTIIHDTIEDLQSRLHDVVSESNDSVSSLEEDDKKDEL